MAYGTYLAEMQGVSVSAAKTLVQVATPNAGLIAVTRCWIEQSGSATSEQVRGQLLRKSAAATGLTSFTPLKTAPGQAASGCAGGTSATGVNATGEGTDSDIVLDRGFNLLQGWEWVAVSDKEWIIVPESSFIGLKLATTPAAARTIEAGIEWFELN